MPSNSWALRNVEVIRLLVVDDCEGDRQLIEELLSDIEDVRYEVFGVGSLRDADKALALYQFDIVVLDYNLGDGCGLDYVRETPHLRRAPTILLTGYRNRELDRIALEAGANDLLYKNELQTSILERAIRYAIGRFKAVELQRQSQKALEQSNAELRDAQAQIEVLGANSIKLAEYLAAATGDGERLYIDRNAKNAETEIREKNCRLGIWRVSPAGRTVSLNAAMAALLGMSEAKVKRSRRSFASFFVKQDQDRAERELMIWLNGMSSSFEGELSPLADDQPPHRVVACGSPLKMGVDDKATILISVVDVTERRRSEASIQSMVVTDPLTGVLNRLAFTQYFPKVLASAERTGHQAAVLYVDLDGFKEINDTFGHHAGDNVLKHASDTIRACTRKSDLVARLGGDEFVVVLTNVDTSSNAALVARHILNRLRAPCKIDEKDLKLDASIGISIYPADTTDPDQLLRYADLALYRRKGAKGAGYNFFDPDMCGEVERRSTVGSELKTAVDRGSFYLAYQPIVSLSSGEVVEVEALIHWNHPGDGPQQPADLMRAVEDSGRITEIGHWLLREALERAEAWSKAAGRPIPVAVNLAGRQLRQNGFLDEVQEIVAQTGCDPRLLAFEIEETVIGRNEKVIRQFIKGARDAGLSVTVDGFGSASSSLMLLRALSFERVKVSPGIIRDVGGRDPDMAVAEAMIGLAHTMNMQVTGDGVESRWQFDALRRLKCDGAQGPFVCRPLDSSEILNWIEKRASTTSAHARLPRAC